MDQIRFVEAQYRIEHRHKDGSWAQMEEVVPHDAAAHDPERRWSMKRIFRCRTCDESVTLSPGEEGDPPAR
jgi:hypothetical protein